ncbi:MAG: cupin domain-containing protein [Hyphomicrobiaceae bacterium]|nr:cupin domain-containing protein [Hyphomicrobiaceae bacterium]
MTIRIETYRLEDDGTIPNNGNLPLVLYRSAIMTAPGPEAERTFKRLFEEHGWCGAWVDGIYPFHHYHARSHEVLGIAAGTAEVQFGGPAGPVLTLAAGDAVAIPAGVGHRRHDGAPGLVVVGAYPRGQEDWDLKRATAVERAQALTEIPRVALPAMDPIAGEAAGLVMIWR